jgi:hypothetical protein
VGRVAEAIGTPETIFDEVTVSVAVARLAVTVMVPVREVVVEEFGAT